MSPQVFNEVLNGATFYAIKPFPSQSQTKRKNWVKFLFSHFFVVPQKVLWKTIIKQIGLFWLKSVYLICYLETVTLVLAISLIFLFILSIIIGNFLYRYITACLFSMFDPYFKYWDLISWKEERKLRRIYNILIYYTHLLLVTMLCTWCFVVSLYFIRGLSCFENILCSFIH